MEHSQLHPQSLPQPQLFPQPLPHPHPQLFSQPHPQSLPQPQPQLSEQPHPQSQSAQLEQRQQMGTSGSSQSVLGAAELHVTWVR